MKKIFFILITLAAILLGVWAAFMYSAKFQRASVETKDWVMYKNEKYGFEIMHPKEWKVGLNESLPAISIYKDHETFDFHGTSTVVLIYPQGVGTEGVQSKTATSTILFSEKTKIAWDLILENDKPWAMVAYFATTTPKWNEFGFIWAGTTIGNEKVSCMKNGAVINEGECEFGIESEGAQVARTGDVNQIDRDIEIKMLESFRILK